MTPAAVAEVGLGTGVVVTTFFIGMRHGVDWDHIAALADINGSTADRRKGAALSFAYIAGHAVVVALLGTAAVFLGTTLPGGVDRIMGRVVGATLIALGAYVLVALLREKSAFRMSSRWMVVFHAARRLVHRRRSVAAPALVEIEHDHEHSPNHDHGHRHGLDGEGHTLESSGSNAVAVTTRHRHRHRHVVTAPSDAFVEYGSGTAAGVGAIHGIGAETPTQLALLAAAAGAEPTTGLALVGAFIVGLIVSNTGVALLASFGLAGARRNFRLYAAVAVTTALLSMATGAFLIFGRNFSVALF